MRFLHVSLSQFLTEAGKRMHRHLNNPRHLDHSMVNSFAHQKPTFEASSKAIVLLKNDGGLLPLNPAHIHSIAVVGPAAAEMQFGATGSPSVHLFFYSIGPLDGIKKRVGVTVTVNYAHGEEADTPIKVFPTLCHVTAEVEFQARDNSQQTRQ